MDFYRKQLWCHLSLRSYHKKATSEGSIISTVWYNTITRFTLNSNKTIIKPIFFIGGTPKTHYMIFLCLFQHTFEWLDKWYHIPSPKASGN